MTSPKPRTTAPRVLVVEDEPSLRDLYAYALEEAGCIVAQAADGVEASEMLGRVEPDLVLLDLVMPAAPLDGFDFLARLGRRDVPVIVVSALTEGLADAFRTRVAAVISKPADIHEVTRLVIRHARRPGAE